MSKDVIGDFLTIIRNGIARSKPYVVAPHSRIKHEMALLLKEEGFIRDVELIGEGVSRQIKVQLKYNSGESVIHEIVRISTPSCRMYEGASQLRGVSGGFGIAILSTNKGIMTNKKARELSVGGEVLCTVW